MRNPVKHFQMRNPVKYFRTFAAARNAFHLDMGFNPFADGLAVRDDSVGVVYREETEEVLAKLGYIVDPAKAAAQEIEEERQRRWAERPKEQPEVIVSMCDNGHKWKVAPALFNEPGRGNGQCPTCGEWYV